MRKPQYYNVDMVETGLLPLEIQLEHEIKKLKENHYKCDHTLVGITNGWFSDPE